MVDLPSKDGSELVYLDGEIIPAAEARLPLSDQGLLYGFGYFETFRTSGGRPHHWAYNQRRLIAACAKAGIALPANSVARDESRLRELTRSLLQSRGWRDAVFRYTITAGTASRASEFLTVRRLPDLDSAKVGITVRTLNLTRDNGEWVPRPKSLNYANVMLGLREMASRTSDPSDEGLFLAREGELVVETARQNVAWVVGQRIHYPDPSLGGVAGTCLSWMIEQDMPVQTARASLQEITAADAVFVLNSVRGITGVRTVFDASDGELKRWSNVASHAVVEELQQRWSAALERTAVS